MGLCRGRYRLDNKTNIVSLFKTDDRKVNRFNKNNDFETYGSYFGIRPNNSHRKNNGIILML